MKNIISIVIIITIAFTMTITPTFASVDGITSENYLDYEKPIADAYGYNKGECDRPYLEGEEYFYNEYYDHWNVDKVYDESIVAPKEEEVVVEEEIVVTPTEEVVVEPTKEEKVVTPTKTTPKKKVTVKYNNNLSVAKKWTKKHYKKYKIKVVNYNKVPKKRKSSKKIYIEKVPTISDGGYNGHCTINGAYVRYSKKVPKGTKQTCYCVWNPKNNACDDVVAFANCNKIK